MPRLAILEDWLKHRSTLIPLEASGPSPDDDALREVLRSAPQCSGTLVEAMLWLRIGRIERAHELVQHGEGKLDAYLHGVVHRLEGDDSNACYWFHRANDSSLLRRVGEAILVEMKEPNLLAEARRLRIFDGDRFSPDQLVAAVRQVRQEAWRGTSTRRPATEALVQQLCQWEWAALWSLIAEST